MNKSISKVLRKSESQFQKAGSRRAAERKGEVDGWAFKAGAKPGSGVGQRLEIRGSGRLDGCRIENRQMFVGESLAEGKRREVLGLFWGLSDWCEAQDEGPVSPTSQ